MTSRINDKRPLSSIIRQFTQNTVKVCFTLIQCYIKTMTLFFPGKWFSGKRLSGKRLSGKVTVRETSYPGNVFQGNVFPGKWLSGKRPLTIGKHVVDFILLLFELVLGVTAEALRANSDLKSAFLIERGQLGTKFQVQGVVPHQPFFMSEN